MSRFDSSLLLFEAMDGLDDAFIQEGMLPETAVSAPIRGKGRRRDNILTRFARSGWAVAILCAVVFLMEYFGYTVILITGTALLAYIPLATIMLVLWYLIGHVL